jgi:hypothetical protein
MMATDKIDFAVPLPAIAKTQTHRGTAPLSEDGARRVGCRIVTPVSPTADAFKNSVYSGGAISLRVRSPGGGNA